MKITVIGSCVTRDLFNYAEKDEFSFHRDVRFISPFSLVSKPFPEKYCISLEDFINDAPTYNSKWFRENLIRDFRKSLFNDLITERGEYCVIDLADARINLARFVIDETEYYCSKSVPFDLHNSASFTKGKLKGMSFDVISPRDIKLEDWYKALSMYSEKLLSLFPANKIIVIENCCSDYFINNDGKLDRYLESEMIDMRYTSHLLFKKLYSFFEAKMPGCKVIKIPNYSIGDAKNIWGRHPFHFSALYYRYLLDCIRKIINNDEEKIIDLFNQYELLFKQIFENALLKNNLSKDNMTNVLSNILADPLDTKLKERIFAVINSTQDITFANHYHYGIDDIKINRFLTLSGKKYISKWVYPADFKGMIIIDRLSIGKGISVDDLIGIINSSTDKQLFVILNEEILNKLISKINIPCIIEKCEILDKFKIVFLSKNPAYIHTISKNLKNKYWLMDLQKEMKNKFKILKIN